MTGPTSTQIALVARMDTPARVMGLRGFWASFGGLTPQLTALLDARAKEVAK